MPRVRADDYDVKIQTILDAAAALFARASYPGVKMQDIAKACGASKSMLYHYFKTKDEILFALSREHLETIIATTENLGSATDTPQQRFLAYVLSYTQRSAQSRRRHVVAMNDVKFLPEEMQLPIVQLERRVVDVASSYLRDLNPKLPAKLYKPYAMVLIGMLNWTDIWYKPGGAIKPREMGERIAQLFLEGFPAAR